MSEELLYLSSTALWTRLLAIGTFLMVLVLALTAGFSIKTWRDSIKKDREKVAAQLFKEFIDSGNHLAFNALSKAIYPDAFVVMGTLTALKLKHEEFFKNYIRIGKFFKKGKVTLEEIEFYFDKYLFISDEFMNFIHNLKTLRLTLDKEDFQNIDFLIKRIGKKKGFREYEKAIRDNFNIKFKQKVGGIINFKGILGKIAHLFKK